ncbi:MAG TPA: hypothetical protein VLB44_10165, partial [Kofleriaceae bacterium]|nr:hypothetical protein [Kofleriaceae bacterium]
MLTCNAGGILDELVAVGHDGVIAERQLDFAAAWAFRGEGIAWTPDLDELEHARNGVAHEGGMPGYL